MNSKDITISSILEKLYNHAFDMVKFGETKNTVLIAFNGAIIVGISKLAYDTSYSIVYYYSLFIIFMCAISAFICSSALMAKLRHKTHEISLYKNDNLLFFATVAHMKNEELIETITQRYGCIISNANYEIDLAKQAIITSQIAYRKFKLFNLAVAFTFCAILTPLSLFIYKIFFDHDK